MRAVPGSPGVYRSSQAETRSTAALDGALFHDITISEALHFDAGLTEAARSTKTAEQWADR